MTAQNKPAVADNSGEALRVSGYVGGRVKVYSTTKFYIGAGTTVTYEATDGSGHRSTCSVAVLIHDEEPPALHACADVHSTTVDGRTAATLGEGVLRLDLPPVTDNSDQHVSVVATVDGAAVTDSTPFAYDRATAVTFTATDGSGLVSACEISVTVAMSASPRYVLAVGADYARIASGGAARAEFDSGFQRALAAAIGIAGEEARVVVAEVS
jgi:hypothetical protein